MRTITVYFDDGGTITTSINGTDDEIASYYLGKRFEAGSDTEHHVAILVHFHDTDRKIGLRIRNIESGSVRRILDVRKELDGDRLDCIWLKVSDTEYSTDDVWFYDQCGKWLKGIGYKHPTAN